MRRDFAAMLETEAGRSHEPRLHPDYADPVEDFIRQNPDEAYDVCVDAVQKNLRPATDGKHLTVELALRCVALSGREEALAFLESVAFQQGTSGGVASRAVYWIGRLAPRKRVWALAKRLEMESNPGTRSALAFALLASGDPSAVEPLEAAAKKSPTHWFVGRWFAVHTSCVIQGSASFVTGRKRRMETGAPVSTNAWATTSGRRELRGNVPSTCPRK